MFLKKQNYISTTKNILKYCYSQKHTINKAIKEYNSIYLNEEEYIPHSRINKWLETHKHIFSQLESFKIRQFFQNLNRKYKNNITSNHDNGPFALNQAYRFFEIFGNTEEHRKIFNHKIVSNELKKYESLFDNIEGRKLDLQQRTAIVSEEDNNIVLAGAGSGKTTTIVGKVKYLIDRFNIDPKEILLISFTKKSADELAHRIDHDSIEVKTFHKFGLDIVTESEGVRPNIYKSDNVDQFLEQTFYYFLQNIEYKKKTVAFFLKYLKSNKTSLDFSDKNRYYHYQRNQKFKTYADIKNKTKKRETVKSLAEFHIANFLFFNRIEYSYNTPFPHFNNNTPYYPNFTLSKNYTTIGNHSSNFPIFIDHNFLDQKGKLPIWFSNGYKNENHYRLSRIYKQHRATIKKLHRHSNTTLIETFETDFNQGKLIYSLKKELIKLGVSLKPMNEIEIWDLLKKTANEELEELLSLFKTFLVLIKSNNISISDLYKRANSFLPNDKKRTKFFLNLFVPIFNHYNKMLSDTQHIDFSDMINKATFYKKNLTHKKKYSYIIIDEFQDISLGRYQLVEQVKKQNPNCKLFVVGDDWQSIYRFTGSDISLINNFEHYFGYALHSKIETTYRFNDPLISISSKFILKNPSQQTKALRSYNTRKTELEIVFSEKNDDTLVLKNIFDRLKDLVTMNQKKIMILGRYSFDIDRIKNKDKYFTIDYKNGVIEYPLSPTVKIKADFLTVHKSKGLESDIVIVLNNNSGSYGFPSEIFDDKVLSLVLNIPTTYENEEERRLFYVAMTRAKEKLFLIADSKEPSKFIRELEIEMGLREYKKCPKCHSGELIRREGITNGRKWGRLSCNNFKYGCMYAKWL